MKKFLILISVVFVAVQAIGYGQTGFDLLWKIDNWGATHGASVTQMARFSPDGKSIYFVVENGSGDKSVVFQVSSETGETISQSERIDQIYDFDMSESGNIYVTVQLDDGLKIWDAKTHKQFDQLKPIADTYFTKVAVSPDEKFAIVYNISYSDGHLKSFDTIYVYDITAKRIIKAIPSIAISELRYSRDGKTFVVGGVAEVMNDNGDYVKKERLILYDATTWEEKAVLAETFYQSGFKNIHYSFDGKFVAATGTNLGCITNLETLQTQTFSNHPTYGEFRNIQLLQDGKDYYINYSNHTLHEMRIVIYNDGKVVNSFIKDYWHVATGNGGGKFKIFVDYSYQTGDMIGVLIPSHTSITEKSETSISVNYSENVLSVSYSGIESQKAKIIVSDVSGKEVYSGVVELTNSSTTQVPMKLDNGVFLYKIVANSREVTGKFVVAR